jgi:hypothetical protein
MLSHAQRVCEVPGCRLTGAYHLRSRLFGCQAAVCEVHAIPMRERGVTLVPARECGGR